jgi:hypothetical protein
VSDLLFRIWISVDLQEGCGRVASNKITNIIHIGLIVESSRASPSWIITGHLSFKATTSRFQKSGRSVALEFGRLFDEREVCLDEPCQSSQAPVTKLMTVKDGNWIYVRVTNGWAGKLGDGGPNRMGDFGDNRNLVVIVAVWRAIDDTVLFRE